jgi:hypothetical protein
MLGGMGQRTKAPTKGGDTGDVAPSNKVQLIKGDIPKYKGDVKVSLELDTEPIVVTIYGAPGLGKTHNAFTFPDPAICDTEMKGEKVWRKFWLGQCQGYRIAKDGSIQSYTWDQSVITLEKSRLSHAEDWGEVASFFDHYAQDPDIQTLVYDSESDLREMAEAWTLGETGKKTLYGGESGGTKAYSLAFGKLRYILFNAKKYGKNLVYCAKVKDEYVNDKKTTRQIHDGYSKQFFYSGYVIKLRLGVVNSSGEVLYKRHVFGEVEKAENMRPGYYPPYLVDPSYKGIMEGLVRGSEWTQSVDAFIRDVIDPAMKEKGVVR